MLFIVCYMESYLLLNIFRFEHRCIGFDNIVLIWLQFHMKDFFHCISIAARVLPPSNFFFFFWWSYHHQKSLFFWWFYHHQKSLFFWWSYHHQKKIDWHCRLNNPWTAWDKDMNVLPSEFLTWGWICDLNLELKSDI